MIYEVIGRYLNNADIIGFKIRNIETKEIKKIRKEEFTRLVKQGNIQGFDIKEFEGKEYIVGRKMSEIDIASIKGVFDIYDRVLNEDGKVIGYRIIEEDTHKKETISIEDAWELAFNGSLKGIRALYKRSVEDNNAGCKLLIVDNLIDLVV